jgi:hypothetical protein
VRMATKRAQRVMKTRRATLHRQVRNR